MTVNTLIKLYQGNITIIRATNSDNTEYENIYIGNKYDIPTELINQEVFFFFATEYDMMKICIM